MMLSRLRNAAVSGMAVLLLSGAGVAFAANSPTSPPTAVTTGGSSAIGQQVDVQQGDQSAPDTASASTEAAGVEAPQAAGLAAETDGPGGHADAAGSIADYQFQGEQ
jgi:glycerate-2-kinase